MNDTQEHTTEIALLDKYADILLKGTGVPKEMIVDTPTMDNTRYREMMLKSLFVEMIEMKAEDDSDE